MCPNILVVSFFWWLPFSAKAVSIYRLTGRREFQIGQFSKNNSVCVCECEVFKVSISGNLDVCWDLVFAQQPAPTQNIYRSASNKWSVATPPLNDALSMPLSHWRFWTPFIKLCMNDKLSISVQTSSPYLHLYLPHRNRMIVISDQVPSASLIGSPVLSVLQKQ